MSPTRLLLVAGLSGLLALGSAYHGGGMPGWAHKLGHGAVGCVTGAIAGAADHAGKGCASGAAGAVVGEIVGEEYLKLRIPRLFGGDTTFGEILHQTTNVSRLAGGLAAGAVGGDANIGAQTAGVAVQNNAIQNLIPLMVSAAYVTYEGDGNPLDGLAKVGSGDHSLGKAIDSGKASVVQVAYENFPEATEKSAKILAPVGAALAVPYEMAEKVVTFLDQRTGQIISRKWNSLDPYTQNLIKGFGKIISVTYIAKEAGAILNISKELDKAKLAGKAVALRAAVPERINTSSGIVINKPTSNKTTTILGTFKDDLNRIINQDLKAPKDLNYTSARPGEYNVLNTPDNLFSQLGPDKYWEEINKPFLDSAINRGDNIVLATKPAAEYLNMTVGNIERLTGFGREYDYLISKGYRYDYHTGYMRKD